MKHNILIHSIAALLAVVPFSRAEEKKAEEKSPAAPFVSADGTATITIDINGKKETRTFKLGDGKNNIFKFENKGDGAQAGGTSGLGDFGFKVTKPAKHEKGPWVGIAMEPVQDVVRAQLSLAPGEGVVINHVAPESPAEKAGLQANDILLRFEDQIVVEPSQLKKLIAMKKPGDSVKLTYLRKGERKDATVTLIEHEIEPADGGPMQWLGNQPGVFNFTVPGAAKGKQPDLREVEEMLRTLNGKHPEIQKRIEGIQDQLRQFKDKHPGVIVEKHEWMSGSPEQMLKGQIEKLKQSLKNSDRPKEEVENIIRNLERMRHEVEEAMERTKRNAEEIMKNAQRAVDDAANAINGPRKSPENEKHEKGEQPKKPGEPL